MIALNAQLEFLLQRANYIHSDEIAEVVRNYRDVFDRHQFRLRPSVGSISLVSCSNCSPQLGFSDIKGTQHLRETLEALRERRVTLNAPGRPTPEKSLQSWLILEAMQNGGRLESIERSVNDCHSYRLVSDEIALKNENNERIVADLLLVREDRLGESEFVNVELKAQRTTETHKQVEKFSGFIREPDRSALWRNFAETMLGGEKRRWKEPGECRGLVIWPSRPDGAAARGSTVQLVNQYKLLGVDTICYSGPEYRFRPEYPEASASESGRANGGLS